MISKYMMLEDYYTSIFWSILAGKTTSAVGATMLARLKVFSFAMSSFEIKLHSRGDRISAPAWATSCFNAGMPVSSRGSVRSSGVLRVLVLMLF
jgi:hypothetical protein